MPTATTAEGSTRFVGLQRVRRVDGQSGALVLESAGRSDGRAATWTASGVAGSADPDPHGLDLPGPIPAPRGSPAVSVLDDPVIG
jgi:hypothetical protein